MTSQAKITANGRIAVPKDVRDRLAWQPGTALEIVEGPGSITLSLAHSKRHHPDFAARLRALQQKVGYKGPKPAAEACEVAIDALFKVQDRWGPVS